MSGSLKGWVRLRNLRPGAVFVTREGTMAVKAAYSYNSRNPQPMCVLLENGGYAHFAALDQEWVFEVDVKIPQVRGLQLALAAEDIKQGQAVTEL